MVGVFATCLITLPDGKQITAKHGPNLLDGVKPYGDITALREHIVKALSEASMPLTSMNRLVVTP